MYRNRVVEVRLDHVESFLPRGIAKSVGRDQALHEAIVVVVVPCVVGRQPFQVGNSVGDQIIVAGGQEVAINEGGIRALAYAEGGANRDA